MGKQRTNDYIENLLRVIVVYWLQHLPLCKFEKETHNFSPLLTMKLPEMLSVSAQLLHMIAANIKGERGVMYATLISLQER